GLANYAALTRDPIFHKVVWNSAVFTLGSVGVKVVLGMLMALALQQALVARSLVRALLLVPWVIPTVITALTWHWMFNALWGVVTRLLTRQAYMASRTTLAYSVSGVLRDVVGEPFYWMVNTSLSTSAQPQSLAPYYYPSPATVGNYAARLGTTNLPTWMRNSA